MFFYLWFFNGWFCIRSYVPLLERGNIKKNWRVRVAVPPRDIWHIESVSTFVTLDSFHREIDIWEYWKMKCQGYVKSRNEQENNENKKQKQKKLQKFFLLNVTKWGYRLSFNLIFFSSIILKKTPHRCHTNLSLVKVNKGGVTKLLRRESFSIKGLFLFHSLIQYA